MKYGSDEVEDRAVLDSVRRRMELALESPTPRVASLLTRLEQPDGPTWGRAALQRALGEPVGLEQRLGQHFSALLAASLIEPDDDARFLVAVMLAAAHVETRGVLPAEREGAPGRLRPDDLLDLAGELDDAWGDLLARAARSLRGGKDGGPTLPSVAAETVGPYVLLEPLGRGSFGSVYRAYQSELDRPVALKLLRPERLSARAERRFLEEGRILSSLSHPGIATLYAIGFEVYLGVRSPYLAMELVRGKPVTRFAADQNLSIRARVRLLVQACDALQHVHERGVVHRDLHPSNLLVRDDGTLKVVDFGAALTPRSEQEIRASLPLGAVAYLGPEQASGETETVDARTDVYALGAVLFELLTGETPHDLRDLDVEAGLELARTGTPRLLSSVVPQSDQDLEAICSKALGERSTRYPTARDLGDDLRRFLGRWPVEARPRGFLYSAGLLARRHSREVLLLATGLLALVFLGAIAVVGWSRASEFALLQAATRDETEQVVAELTDLVLQQANAQETEWDSESFIESWDRGIRPLTIQSEAVRANVFELVGRHRLDVGEFEEARKNRAEALRLRERVATRQTLESRAGQEAWLELGLARIRLGDVLLTELNETGRLRDEDPDVRRTLDEVRDHFAAALALDRSLLNVGVTATRVDNLSWSHLRLFDLEWRQGNESPALAHLERANGCAYALLALDPERPHTHFLLAEIDLRAASWARSVGDVGAARWMARASAVHARRAFGAAPGRRPFERVLDQAQALLESLGAALDAEAPTDLRPRAFVAAACARVGRHYAKGSAPEASIPYYLQAVRFLSPVLGATDEGTRWVLALELARYHKRASRVLGSAGRSEEAAQHRVAVDRLLERAGAGRDPELWSLAEDLILHPYSVDVAASEDAFRALASRFEARLDLDPPDPEAEGWRELCRRAAIRRDSDF